MINENWNETKEVLLEGLDDRKRDIAEVLLENERRYLSEAATSNMTSTSNVARLEKVAMPLIRRVTNATVAQELVGVQPLSQPVGQVISMRFRYANTVANGGPTQGDEASGVNLYEKYSLIASGESYIASDARTPYQITLALEADGGNEMALEQVKKTVETKTRKLKAKWTTEADEDASAMHNIDMEQEMINILSDEIIREIDQEIITELTSLAGTVKSFDFSLADGRHASEKFTALNIGLSDLSNQIAIKTKRGGASWALVSPNVLVAMRYSNSGSFVPATASGDVSPQSSMFAGTLNGSIRVYVDIYATSDYALLGYKGASELDTGLVYLPYIQLMQSQVVTDAETFDPRVGLRTRYALASFTDPSTDLGNSADFYARGSISNLTLGGF